MLLRDFNARTGKLIENMDVLGQFGETMVNANGTKLIKFLIYMNMIGYNNRMRHKTIQYTRKEKHETNIIDYILMNTKNSNVIVSKLIHTNKEKKNTSRTHNTQHENIQT